MSKGFEKNGPEWNFFKELYRIAEQYWVPEDTDSYWESLVLLTDDLNNRYKHLGPIVTYMIVGFINGIEVKSKEVKKK